MINYEEVLTKCLSETMPPCQVSCPLQVDTREYVQYISQGNFNASYAKIWEKLPFPGILGRICLHPCETQCRRGAKDEAVALCALKRSSADYTEYQFEKLLPRELPEKKEKIAIVGGGPAGLMAAYDLRLAGYKVVLYEAAEMLGGMLTQAIPPYRLPRDIVIGELNVLHQIGVTILTNSRLGKDFQLSELLGKFSAVLLATGLPGSKKLTIEGDNLIGVLGGLDFLRLALNGEAGIPELIRDRHVVVVGGGNVAVDAARTAIRLKARDVLLVYRRTKAEMRALPSEVNEALEEGVNLKTGLMPRRIIGKKGRVTGIEFVPFKATGEAGMVELLPTDCIISAIGQVAELDFLNEEFAFLAPEGQLEFDSVTCTTKQQGLFLAGDLILGASTVVEAMASGRRAALYIDRYLQGQGLPSTSTLEESSLDESFLNLLNNNISQVEVKPRKVLSNVAPELRINNFTEVNPGYNREDAIEEAGRCLQCECRFCVKECEFLQEICASPLELVRKLAQGEYPPEVPYLCNICELCVKVCPQDLDIGALLLGLRQQMVERGEGPLPGHAFVDRDQDHVNSEAFLLTMSNPERNKVKDGNETYAFFPGCSLSGYSPELTLKAFQHLKNIVSCDGIILHCCGAPNLLIGRRAKFDSMLAGICTQMEKLESTTLVVACPDCYHTIKNHASNIKITTLYHLLAEKDSLRKLSIRNDDRRTFTIHDSCKARWECDLQDAIRKILHHLGHNIVEMPYSREMTRCCGNGGMVPYTDLDFFIRLVERRLADTNNDIVTYCAACRETLSSQGGSAVHILDLIFNQAWGDVLRAEPKTGRERRENQTRLREMLQAVDYK